jgi:hypothetical protein
MREGWNLSLFDLSGKRVMEAREERAGARGDNFVIDLRRSCPGSYLCRARQWKRCHGKEDREK